MFNCFLVGGAVRDIIGRREWAICDRDFVVVGSTIDEMLDLGFKQVGKGFPVFLHPKTGEEFALARKEVKTGDKYTDFKFEFTSDVTLLEDLERRDFTMNAIAAPPVGDSIGEIYDPFNGYDDIKNKIIRHVNSEHFIEDPLRILRAARFASILEFRVADETLDLMKDMVAKGMLEHLTAERIWKETEKVFKNASDSSIYFTVLRTVGALKVLFPEIDALFDTPEQVKYHPSGNTGLHTMAALDIVYSKVPSWEHDMPILRFATLCHDLGKTLTPKDILPSHYGHDERGLAVIKKLCDRLKVPNEYRDFALLSCTYHMKYFLFEDMSIKKLHDILYTITKFKDFNVFNQLTYVFEADACSEVAYLPEEQWETYSNNQINIVEKIRLYMLDLFSAGKRISYKDVPNHEKYTGALCRTRLRECRISNMKKVRRREDGEFRI